MSKPFEPIGFAKDLLAGAVVRATLEALSSTTHARARPKVAQGRRPAVSFPRPHALCAHCSTSQASGVSKTVISPIERATLINIPPRYNGASLARAARTSSARRRAPACRGPSLRA